MGMMKIDLCLFTPFGHSVERDVGRDRQIHAFITSRFMELCSSGKVFIGDFGGGCLSGGIERISFYFSEESYNNALRALARVDMELSRKWKGVFLLTDARYNRWEEMMK